MTETVVLYSTGCPRCTVLKKKLEDKQISYEEKNSVDEMLELGIMSVPVLSVDGEMMDFVSAVSWLNNQ